MLSDKREVNLVDKGRLFYARAISQIINLLLYLIDWKVLGFMIRILRFFVNKLWIYIAKNRSNKWKFDLWRSN